MDQMGSSGNGCATKQESPGLKFDNGKPSLGLIDGYFLTEVARVLDFGAKKYAPHNWRGGIQWSRTIDAILRHVEAFNSGEDLDPETGLSHIAQAACNCMFLLNFTKTHPELDDRYKGERQSDKMLAQKQAQLAFPAAEPTDHPSTKAVFQGTVRPANGK